MYSQDNIHWKIEYLGLKHKGSQSTLYITPSVRLAFPGLTDMLTEHWITVTGKWSNLTVTFGRGVPSHPSSLEQSRNNHVKNTANKIICMMVEMVDILLL